MIILSLDTTTRAGSVAVMRDGDLLVELAGDAALTHGQRLPADLMRALDTAGVPLEAVTLLAVTAGPGSFTGLRVGIATMQGLAMARGLRIVPVSTLEALAHAAAGRGVAIAAWMDAQRREVFATLYEPDGTTLRMPPMAATPAGVLERWRDRLRDAEVLFIGDGAVRYQEEIAKALGGRARVEPPPLLATIAGRIAAADPSRAVLPHAVVPIYVRKPDAELARDRRPERS